MDSIIMAISCSEEGKWDAMVARWDLVEDALDEITGYHNLLDANARAGATEATIKKLCMEFFEITTTKPAIELTLREDQKPSLAVPDEDGILTVIKTAYLLGCLVGPQIGQIHNQLLDGQGGKLEVTLQFKVEGITMKAVYTLCFDKEGFSIDMLPPGVFYLS